MKKNKGFTLVELLAVIVILAIIMIIAIPAVLDTMSKAQKKTFIEYTTKIYDLSNKEYVSQQLLGSSYPSCTIFDITQDIGLDSTGNYKGYVLIKNLDDGSMKTYITLYDNDYMIYAVKYNDELDVNDILAYGDTEYLSKENLAAVARCSVYYNKNNTSGTASDHGNSSKTNVASLLLKENNNTNGDTYRSNEWKDKIVSVSFRDELNLPNNNIVNWDLSSAQDNSIIGYLTESSEAGLYNLVISANGYINFPVDSRHLFDGLTNVKSYNFTNTKTEGVTRMGYMFNNNKSLESLNLSMFDTTVLNDIGLMFNNCNSIRTINFNGWHPKLYSFASVFNECHNIESLDLSNFDVKNSKNFNNAFYNTESLRTLNISTWKPNSISSMRNMFAKAYLIESIDLSGFTNFDTTFDGLNIFNEINKSVIIKTGNNDFKNSLISSYPGLNIQ